MGVSLSLPRRRWGGERGGPLPGGTPPANLPSPFPSNRPFLLSELFSSRMKFYHKGSSTLCEPKQPFAGGNGFGA